MPKILVVEDDKPTLDTIVDLLMHDKHTVDTAENGPDGWELLQQWDYDLVVLDWTLPEMDGLEVLSRLRKSGRTTPVLFLTGRGSIDNRTQGLDSGADDYLCKPFDVRELQSRVRALLRRPAALTDNILRAADLELDLGQFKCSRQGAEIKLLPKEFSLLEFFIRNRGRVFSVEDLLDRLWSADSDASIDAARQTIKRLRNKIDVADKPSYITTVFGVGYKMDMQ